MSTRPFDTRLYTDGVTLVCAYAERGMQEFPRLALTVARDLDAAPEEWQPYFRSWYEGARHLCEAHGTDTSGFTPLDDVSAAMASLSIWGQSPYPMLGPDAASTSRASSATEDELRRLMGIALTTPTPEAVMAFVDFTSKMKRLAPYNMMMVYTQRPGATAVASRDDWAAVGQTVRPDAIPILILRPMGPIRQVFELHDTLPPQERDPRIDPFGTAGEFDDKRLDELLEALAKPGKRKLRIEVTLKDYGGNLAGRIATFGLFAPAAGGGDLAGADDYREAIGQLERSRYWITVNRRHTPAEQFSTLLHELGHLFCGHLGAFDADNPAADEYGWPDRRHLPKPAKEIEAELVAWHICEREGLVTGSPLYLKGYMQKYAKDVGRVDLDRVIRAIARVRAYLGDPKPSKPRGVAGTAMGAA